MDKAKKSISGKKTYISSLILMVMTVLGSLLQWNPETLQTITGLGVAAIGIFLRSGVAKSAGLSEGVLRPLQELASNAKVQVDMAKANFDKEAAKLRQHNIDKLNPEKYAMDLNEALGLLERFDKLQGKSMNAELTKARSNAAMIVEKFTSDPNNSKPETRRSKRIGAIPLEQLEHIKKSSGIL